MTPALMNFKDLLHDINGVQSKLPDITVNNLVLDSRKVSQHDAFVAVQGETVDGSRFIHSAIDNGAGAIMIDAALTAKNVTNVPVIEIARLRQQLPKIADNRYGDPSAAMTLVAVTGTNGKTTCAHLMAQALESLSVKSAVIGTAGQGLTGDLSESTLTTPDVFELRRLLAEFKRAHAEAVVFEASSHGLKQGRLDGLKIDLALFTNLSHDHLDYHADLAEYAAAKMKLFKFPSLTHAVMNLDQPLMKDFADQTRARRTWFYGRHPAADVCLLDSEVLVDGLRLKIQTANGQFEFTSALIGLINIENLLAVFTALLARGVHEAQICTVMKTLTSVRGRMEMLGGGGKPVVVIDYAHTPDALQKALISLKAHTVKKLYCVFGCGGDRDKGKRPKMGSIAEKYADVAVITDDNPRHESSAAIIADIVAGMSGDAQIISERPKAINWAIGQAQAGDVVLIAGKGHETTQQVKDHYISMSDRQLAKSALEMPV